MKCTVYLLSVILLVTISSPVFAGERDNIIARCRVQMKEYGSAMVKACVDQDIEALNALASYQEKAKPFIAGAKNKCRNMVGQWLKHVQTKILRLKKPLEVIKKSYE